MEGPGGAGRGRGTGAGPAPGVAAAAWAALWACPGGAPLWGLGAAAGGAGLVAAGRLLGGRERRLKKVACRPGRLADAKALGIKLPAVVAARGRVCCSKPLRLPEGAGPLGEQAAAGSLLRTSVENFYMKSGLGGQWERESVVLADHTAEAAWWLWDFSGMRLPVVGARKADWVELDKVYEAFDPVGSDVVKHSLDYLRGLKLLGTRTQKHMLRVGEEVTVVGELAWDDRTKLSSGAGGGGGAPAGGEAGQRGADWEGWKGNPERLVLRKPTASGSLPFIITKKPFEELIQELGFWARQCTWLGLGLGGAGLAVFSFHVFRAVQRARREALFRRRMFEAHQRLAEGRSDEAGEEDREAAGLGAGVEGTGAGGYPELCVVCLEKPYDTVFLRCGHLCCCSACVGRVKNKCPICRTWSKTIKTFRP